MKLSKNGEAKKKTRIVELINKIREIQTNNQQQQNGLNFNDNQEYTVLLSLLKKEIKELESAEILEELELPDNIVSIGDTITILTRLNDEPSEEETITLVKEVDPENIESVTIDSPLGNAIYLQSIGSQVVCNIPAGTLQITILEKSKSLKR